jgi:hypothetical protein
LNYIHSQVLGWLDVSESTLNLVNLVTIAYLLVMGVCIAVTSMMDALQLTVASIRHAGGDSEDRNDDTPYQSDE